MGFLAHQISQIRRCLLAMRSGQPRAEVRRRIARRSNTFDRPESLESRILLTSDFGDAPAPYATLLADDGARHPAVGPRLGSARDSETDGIPSIDSDADGSDDDGIVLSTLVTGDVLSEIAVNVQNGGGRLDAWIDFNQDGHWGGAGEQIFDSVPLSEGDHVLTFSVPSTAMMGTTYARFRLSTEGGLGMVGDAPDGEVEDYCVEIESPKATSGLFESPAEISDSASGAYAVFAADIDGDGDQDVLGSSFHDDTVAWYENDGSETFSRRIVATFTSDVFGLFAADVNGDGHLDVLTASLADNTVAWHENDGSQNFSKRVITNAAEGAYRVSAADMDHDGDIDILTASFFDNEIAWYENDGSEGFTKHLLTDEAENAWDAAAVDLDGDGDMDVIGASGADNTVAWFENDGAQSFTRRVITTDAVDVRSITSADVDGDGDVDVLSASNADDTVAWYENDGFENFSKRIITTTADGAFSVFAADVDGDGDVDVLNASRADNSVAWYENDGNRNFTKRVLTDNAFRSRSVFAADIDGDGDLDVIGASFDEDTVEWYENRGFDFGDAPAPYRTLASEDGARHVEGGPTLGSIRDTESDGSSSSAAAADGNDEDGVVFREMRAGDPSAQITVTVQGGGKLDAWIDFNGDGNWGGWGEQIFDSKGLDEGTSTLTFPVPATAVSGPTYGRFRISTEGDLGMAGIGADGEVEDYLVTVEPPIKASGSFVASPEISTGADGVGSVIAADLDNDGDMDVISASELDSKISWYRNEGSGVFSENTISTTASAAENVFAADVDGDGDIDILSASIGDDTIAWYENDGNGIFLGHVISSTADGAGNVHAADMDGDGDTDVLSASINDDTVAWYENDGAENFTPHIISTTADSAWSVAAADLDGDGDLDVLSASFLDATIAWYENDGELNFSKRVITGTADGAWSVFSIDVDGDGDMDVLSTSVHDDTVAWYENDGEANFTERIITEAADGAVNVHAADVDGDGDVDVLSASINDSTLAWYENDGSQNFTQRQITTSADGAKSIFAADMDGDGDLDVLGAASGSDTVSWYENADVIRITVASASVDENSGSLLGTVNRGTLGLSEPLIVSLSSNDTTEIVVPATVTIPANESSADFTLTVLDDPLPDGTQSVVVTASAPEFFDDQALIAVNDHEMPLELIAPTGITDDMTPELSWTGVAGAVRYELYVRNLSSKQRVVDDSDITATSYTPAEPWDGTNYRVWVRGYSITGEEGPWSEADFRFTIRNAPQITSPTTYRITDQTPTLQWDEIPDTQWGSSDSFQIWIKRHQTKHGQIFDIPDQTYTTEPLPMGRYNFWVRSKLDTGLDSGWSRARELVIVTPPTLTGPSGSVSSLAPTITWDALAGAATYELYIQDVTADQSPLYQPTGLVGTSWTFPENLTPGHNYKVWARAYDEKGWRGYYGDAMTFDVVAVSDRQLMDSVMSADAEDVHGLLIPLVYVSATETESRLADPENRALISVEPQQDPPRFIANAEEKPSRNDEILSEQVLEHCPSQAGAGTEIEQPDALRLNRIGMITDSETIDLVLRQWAETDLAFSVDH